MLTEQDKARVRTLFESRGLLYFDCCDQTVSLQHICGRLSEREQSWLDKQTENSSQSRVLLGFFESEEAQAYAFELSDGSAMIGISCFFAVQLGYFFYNALAHRDFLPEAGDISLERSVDELRSFPLGMRRPRCPERLKVAQILVGTALRFLTAHELTHIENGHLRYLKLSHKTTKVSSMAERGHVLTESDALTKQTLEMDADSGAVLFSLNTVMMSDEAMEKADGLGWDPFYRNRKLIIRLWCIAIYTLFRNLEGPTSPIQFSSHPPPVKRALMAYETFVALTNRDHSSWPIDPIRDSIQRSMIEVETLRAWMIEQNTDSTVLKDALSLSGYEESLLKEWARLRPILEPLARSKGKLAPAQRVV